MNELLIGTLLALGALSFVLYPLFMSGPPAASPPLEGSPVCATCGPRPESDALFCSNCGMVLPAPERDTQLAG